MTVTQEHIAKLAVKELEELLTIIGDLSHPGYKVCMCKIRGLSYTQASRKAGISRQAAQRSWQKCIEKRYDIALKRIFHIE